MRVFLLFFFFFSNDDPRDDFLHLPIVTRHPFRRRPLPRLRVVWDLLFVEWMIEENDEMDEI